MSLRSVHILFIFIATVFCIWFALWSYDQYQSVALRADLWLSGISFAIALALSIYFAWFVRKSKQLHLNLWMSVLLLGLSQSKLAQACAVCFGDKDAPMTKGANAGILFLLVVISLVLVAFGSLFIVWLRRSKKLEP